jgi:hypothetical protein
MDVSPAELSCHLQVGVMNQEKLRKLRAYYHSLLGLQHIIDDAAKEHPNMEGTPVRVLADEIARLRADFPSLVPEFRQGDYYSHQSGGSLYFKVAGIRSYLAVTLASLKIAIEEPESTPVTETREFSFVADAELRKVVERDYAETQRAYIAKCWKSVIILSGGAIEAILVDRLLQDVARARSASKAPKGPDITRWDLADVINVCVELGLVSPGAERLSHSVRQYRNLVHPGNEVRNRLTFDAEEARIALEVLHIIHRDLSN